MYIYISIYIYIEHICIYICRTEEVKLLAGGEGGCNQRHHHRVDRRPHKYPSRSFVAFFSRTATTLKSQVASLNVLHFRANREQLDRLNSLSCLTAEWWYREGRAARWRGWWLRPAAPPLGGRV